MITISKDILADLIRDSTSLKYVELTITHTSNSCSINDVLSIINLDDDTIINDYLSCLNM